MNHYEVLGVPMGADPAELRRAYLRLARRHHPDRHVDADATTQSRARRRMEEVNAAWAVLGDPARRRHYDESVRQGTAGTTRTTRVGPAAAPPGSGWHPRGDDTGWMRDFEAWRNETDELPSDEAFGRSRRRHNPLIILPVVLFFVAVAAGCVGLALQSRGLIAIAFVGTAVSGVMFFMLPIVIMSQGRDDE